MKTHFWYLTSTGQNQHNEKWRKQRETTILNFFGISKNISDIKAFERGCLSWAWKLLQFFKLFETTCRSYESLSKLAALAVVAHMKSGLRIRIDLMLINANPDPAFFLIVDPDPETQINADPDTDPDPQPCMKLCTIDIF